MDFGVYFILYHSAFEIESKSQLQKNVAGDCSPATETENCSCRAVVGFE